jgi:hypothetical protein
MNLDFKFFKGEIKGKVIENINGVIVVREMTQQETIDFNNRQQQDRILHPERY